MNNVALSIAGREFLVACAPGEEEHLRALGSTIEEKITAAGVHGLSEARMLLFAALLLADENHDLQQRAAPPSADAARDTMLGGLERLATRMEKLALQLESPLESEPKHL